MNGMDALRIATPYLSRFRGQVFVVKLGGEVLDSPSALRSVTEQLSLLWHLGIRLVVVHGGGSAMDRACARMGIETKKVAGRRITDSESLEVVKMVLGGQTHLDVLSAMRAAGLPVVGLTGVDAGLIVAKRRQPVSIEGETVDFGHVGDIEQVKPAVISHLLEGNYLPVVSPVSGTESGEPLNINADTVASSLACALKAEKLIFVLKVAGILRDIEQPQSLIPFVKPEEISGLVKEGVVAGGMLPKLAAAENALKEGVHAVHLVSAFSPDAIVIEVFTNEGSGTMIGAVEA